MARIPVEIDGASTRLTDLAAGLALAELLPVKSAKTLAARVRAARKFIEANEYGLALATLDDVLALAREASNSDSMAERGAAARISHRTGQLRTTTLRYAGGAS